MAEMQYKLPQDSIPAAGHDADGDDQVAAATAIGGQRATILRRSDRTTAFMEECMQSK